MIRVIGKTKVLNLLYEFDDVFPHNREKISNYEEWASKISNNGLAVVTDNNVHAGMAVFYANDLKGRKGYISLIGLKPNFRGKGLGKAFLDDVIKEMKKNGMNSVLLEVDDDNQSAKDFYTRFGFELEEKRENTQLLVYNIDLPDSE